MGIIIYLRGGKDLESDLRSKVKGYYCTERMLIVSCPMGVAQYGSPGIPPLPPGGVTVWTGTRSCGVTPESSTMRSIPYSMNSLPAYFLSRLAH